MNRYFITTPFVDAYKASEKEISLSEFKKLMRRQADEWGGVGLWRGLQAHGEIPKSILGAPVLAIGTYGGKTYAAVYKKGAEDSLEVELCQRWPDEWDVT